MRNAKLLAAAMVSLTAPPAVFGQESGETPDQDHEWTYADEAHWTGECATGQQQSPAALRTWWRSFAPNNDVDESLTPFLERQAETAFNYQSVALSAQHTGHGIQIDMPASTNYGFRFAAVPRNENAGRQEFTHRLLQLHFHVPAEHHFERQAVYNPPREIFAMEAHFVHGSSGRPRAVLAILFREGADNPFLASLLGGEMPALDRPTVRSDTGDLRELMPTGYTRIYNYVGSLTTPPCTEGIAWYVVATPMTASRQQIAAMRDAVGFANARHALQRRARGIVAAVTFPPRR